MRIITSHQHTEEWFAARLGVPTASRFADIMPGAKGAYKESRREYALELCLERLTGKPAQHFTNDAMYWGTANEDSARNAYAAHKLIAIAQTGFVMHDTIDVGCSPDGLISADGLLEIKCPYNSTKHLGYIVDGVVPKQYQWQVFGQIFVTGREFCDFASFDPRMPESTQLFVARAEMTDGIRESLADELQKFCEYVDEMMEKIK